MRASSFHVPHGFNTERNIAQSPSLRLDDSRSSKVNWSRHRVRREGALARRPPSVEGGGHQDVPDALEEPRYWRTALPSSPLRRRIHRACTFLALSLSFSLATLTLFFWDFQIVALLPAGIPSTQDTLYPEGATITDLEEVRELLHKMQRPAIAPEVRSPLLSLPKALSYFPCGGDSFSGRSAFRRASLTLATTRSSSTRMTGAPRTSLSSTTEGFCTLSLGRSSLKHSEASGSATWRPAMLPRVRRRRISRNGRSVGGGRG